jgi:hypothetical protein
MIKLVINKLIDNNYFHFYHMLVNVQKVELLINKWVGGGATAQESLKLGSPIVIVTSHATPSLDRK